MATTKETIENIKLVIDKAEKFKNAYFWAPPVQAAMRRKMEADNTVPKVEWTDGGDTYEAWFTVECSCRNVYAKGYYYKNGERTTLTAIRNSYKRMIA